MKISLTGSNGFVGKNLLQKLIKDGHHVKVLSSSNANNYKNVTIIKGTLSSDYKVLESFVEDVDFIINCAGEIIDQNKMEETNVHGVKNLLDIINYRKENIKWIQLGSAGIYKRNYHNKKSYEYIGEDAEIHTDNYYEKTKWNADDILLDASRSKFIQVYILRSTAIFGKDMSNDSLRRLIKLIKRRLFFYIGSKNNILSYLHVDDLTDLIVSIISSKHAYSGIYNISNDSKISLTINEVTDLLKIKKINLVINQKFAKLMTKMLPKVLGFPLTDSVIRALTCRSIIDSTKATRELGYKPKKPLHKYIYELVKSS